MQTSTSQVKNVDQKVEKVISIRNLKKSFGNLEVFKDFSLDLFRGENVVVLGRSGSGKSVLIKCLVGLIKPDGGSIELLGKNPAELDEDELDKLRSRIGFLFQSNALYDSMTVRKNLEFPLRQHTRDLKKQEVNERVMEALENVGLAWTVEMMPSQLSGGMRKRVALARTLIMRPEIMLYDEPTTGLDPLTTHEIIQLMLKVQEKYNTSAIIISHDIKCAEQTADRVAVLANGICYAEGSFDDLKKSDDEIIKSFFI